MICILCSCSTTVTEDEGNAYADMNIVFHDKKYMKNQDLKIPNGIDEERMGTLPFAFAFKLDEEPNNVLTKTEFDTFQSEFSQIFSATNRFNVAQVAKAQLADAQLMKDQKNGLINVDEFDITKAKKALYTLNVKVKATSNFYKDGRQGKSIFTIDLYCTPMIAETHETITWFPAFSITAKKDIWQRVSSTGFVTGGIDTRNPRRRGPVLVELIKKAMVLFVGKIYNQFPAGGYVTAFDLEENLANLKASRATGLMQNLEMVVYAREKDNPDSIKIALFNASLETMAQHSGSSILRIWRKSSSSRAKKIIKMIEDDWQKAKEKYDFLAASDGIAEKPDFKTGSGDRK